MRRAFQHIAAFRFVLATGSSPSHPSRYRGRAATRPRGSSLIVSATPAAVKPATKTAAAVTPEVAKDLYYDMVSWPPHAAPCYDAQP